MVSVDLNADVGEGAGTDGHDGPLLDVVTSASIACGVHAGDQHTMRATLEAAARRGVVVGAHPSYDDRAGFGRRDMDVGPAELTALITAQIGALAALARECGTRVRYVKPNGALYHRMAVDEPTALAVIEAARDFDDLVLLAPAGSPAVAVARRADMAVATEAFADRAYLADGSLVSRQFPGAVLEDPDEVADRALSLATEGTVRTIDGAVLEMAPASICVHGDTGGALVIAERVRDALGAAGVTLASFVA
jgi:5-oxoprolinase (ATP-hydrolysing) subunit A